MIARVALAAGFGLDFETCSPAVFAAVMEEITERQEQEMAEQRAQRVRQEIG